MNAKSVHSDRSDTLRAGAGHGSGAATPAAAAASSAAGSGARPRRGRNRIAGRMPTSGKPGTPRGPSPSSGPSFRAPVGQAATQAGVPPSSRRWWQSVHFPITPRARVEARRVVRAHPAAVAAADAAVGVDRGRPPVPRPGAMARAGQWRSQGASRQWLQASERWKTGSAGCRSSLKVTTCRQKPPGAVPFSIAQATTQAWQPTQVARSWTKAGGGALTPSPPRRGSRGRRRRSPGRSRAPSRGR